MDSLDNEKRATLSVTQIETLSENDQAQYLKMTELGFPNSKICRQLGVTTKQVNDTKRQSMEFKGRCQQAILASAYSNHYRQSVVTQHVSDIVEAGLLHETLKMIKTLNGEAKEDHGKLIKLNQLYFKGGLFGQGITQAPDEKEEADPYEGLDIEEIVEKQYQVAKSNREALAKKKKAKNAQFRVISGKQA